MSVQSGNGAGFHAPLQVIEKQVSNVRALPVAQDSYYHISTTTQQNNQIKAVYDQQLAGSKKGEKYNIADNNCETTLQGALSAGRTGVILDAVPTYNLLVLPLQGIKKVSPKALPGKISELNAHNSGFCGLRLFFRVLVLSCQIQLGRLATRHNTPAFSHRNYPPGNSDFGDPQNVGAFSGYFARFGCHCRGARLRSRV